jgi:hypothetical protein
MVKSHETPGQITGVMAQVAPSPASQAVIAALQLTTFCESLHIWGHGGCGHFEG